jgi:iron(III) transport system ATP-binding protein
LCIRPEFIHIGGGEGKAGPNAIDGRVESLAFVGEVYEAEIRVGDALLLARIDPDVAVAEGGRVRFNVDPAHCRLLSA